MRNRDRDVADGRSAGKLHPIENKYMVVAAVVAFLLALLLSHGSLFAAFGALALIAGGGWAARRLMRRGPG
jgi:hypothetical protein